MTFEHPSSVVLEFCWLSAFWCAGDLWRSSRRSDRNNLRFCAQKHLQILEVCVGVCTCALIWSILHPHWPSSLLCCWFLRRFYAYSVKPGWKHLQLCSSSAEQPWWRWVILGSQAAWTRSSSFPVSAKIHKATKVTPWTFTLSLFSFFSSNSVNCFF